MIKEQAKEKIQILVTKFNALVSNDLNRYSEEETKQGFIVPLFTALGWDMQEKLEVSLEERISGDRVDFGFYVNNRPQFYVEAKSFKADLNDEKFARQAIKYSWNKGVTWAVLTDFKTIKVFNADFQSDKLFHSLFFEISCDEYIDKFEQLWLLSKEAFLNGDLNRKAQESGKAIKRVSVTESLYKDLTECRKILTEAIKFWNENVSEHDIDEGVQKLLNRLVFIRVLEDREIEPHLLKNLIREWEAGKYEKSRPPLYGVMVQKFRELDEQYNSNLFSPHPFEQWEEHDDKTKKVIDILYGKPGYYEYDFKIMPADVLGAVYENYLGYKLAQSKKGLTSDKDAKKRKEHGIYYTPEFIVDYIVKNTLTPILQKCQTIDDIMKIKVLDPACGSGSFLIKAVDAIYQRYHEMSFRGSSTYKKIQIITQNIYGVDLDSQAVEIARLNLLINAVEEKILLPSLAKNIKNGNSLISGTDEELKKYFGKDFRDKKPFNWQEEFPEVFKQGGFDVIIGNPPYIKEFVSKDAFDGLHQSPYYQGKMDIWTMFGCISIDLLKDRGMVSFIAPNNWVSNAGASIFRDKILKEGELKVFIDFGDYKIFADAGIQTMVYVFEKQKPEKKYTVEYLRINDKNIEEGKLISSIHGEKQKIQIEPEKLIDKNITFADSESGSIFDKIESKKNFELNDDEISNGIHHHHDSVNKDRQAILGAGFKVGDGIFVLSDSEKNAIPFNDKELELIKPAYTTEQLSRWYGDHHNKEWVIYTDSSFKDSKKIDSYPNIKKHLDKFKKVITSDNKPYGLHRAKKEKFFKGEKIIALRKCLRPTFTYVNFDSYVSATFYIIKSERINQKYLTAILNSNLTAFWLKNKGKMQGNNYQLDKEPLVNISIFLGDEKQQEIIINMVDKIIILNKELREITENSDKWQKLKEEIEKTDKLIDQKIYELYGLTEEEIKVVKK